MMNPLMTNLLAAQMVNWHSFTFLFFALLACGFGAAVLATSNVVRMAFYLTLSLGATAGLFFLAGAEFVGAMQLMIYVGGTLVLLIFGVMLTAQERFINMKTGAGEWVTGLIVGGTLLVLLVRTAFSIPSWTTGPTTVVDGKETAAVIAPFESRTSTKIGLALSGVRVDKPEVADPVRRQGMVGYLLPFVIISMHLLTVLIGAGYMARTKKVRTGRVLEAPARAVPANRKFPFMVKVGIIKGFVINAFLVITLVAALARKIVLPTEGQFGEWSQAFLAKVYALPGWVLPALVLTLIVNLLLLFVVLNWQKWGVVGLLIVPLIQFMFMVNGNVSPLVAGGVAAVMLIPAVALALLCAFGSRPTVWSQME
ncbi:NADH-quinone oxidoreductase subunit J family protein [Anatilimnocola floriformis]|uniref:NADH-quinone oxidoreductase subunit J family protein n=1 Tax=Anatilimnocola floriformis TaxID=2948575 RepID=UPI0020C334B4|nr:NADH-quinone oxidoreductase subunit J [Anatilimnocola floriformis]